MKYRVAIVGCGRMAGSIDDEVPDYKACILPYSHAAAYAEIEETEIVAAADLDPEKLEKFCKRWNVPARYTDYREMIERERPDIVSITTPATARAEIAVFAAEHGVRGIYCEKALACSLEEADKIVEAVEKNGVKFNLGTLRRYHEGYREMRRLVEAGEIGELRRIVAYPSSTLLHGHSHTLDLIMFLSGDDEVEFVHGSLHADPDDGERTWRKDPSVAFAVVQFRNGVRAFMVDAGVWDFEVVGTTGSLRAMNNNIHWRMRKPTEKQGRFLIWHDVPFPSFERISPTVNCIRDLLNAVETGGETSGNVRVSLASTEIAFAIAESHRRNGARVKIDDVPRDLYITSK